MNTPWVATAFVATPGDVPLTHIPPWIKGLVVQVAWGSGPPPQPIHPEWLAEARSRFDVYAWAWCQGTNVQLEARYHAQQAQGYAGFCANMEEPYDAHGNSTDPRYTMPRTYLEELRKTWTGPLGVTTTWSFGSDMTHWINAGATNMPQAFTLEIPSATLTNTVTHAKAWGWPTEQIRPLLQSYPTNGKRPDPTALNSTAAMLHVGGSPYTIEQAMDEPGQAWLQTMRPTIERPPHDQTPPPPNDAKLALEHFLASSLGTKANISWGMDNPREASLIRHGDTNPDHYKTRFGKFLAHLTKAAQ